MTRISDLTQAEQDQLNRLAEDVRSKRPFPGAPGCVLQQYQDAVVRYEATLGHLLGGAR